MLISDQLLVLTIYDAALIVSGMDSIVELMAKAKGWTIEETIDNMTFVKK
jgi:hypothetical protein